MMRAILILVCAIAIMAGIYGCLASQARIDNRGPTSQPAIEQAGNVNTAVQTAMGWVGVNFSQALPWSFMPLMAWQTWLSHRREMWRIRYGGAKA